MPDRLEQKIDTLTSEVSGVRVDLAQISVRVEEIPAIKDAVKKLEDAEAERRGQMKTVKLFAGIGGGGGITALLGWLWQLITGPGG
ncbi:MAG: hypothetical protein AAGE52_01335 [Myxococcota bacterium]